MKAKRAWIRYDDEYGTWEFSPTEPDHMAGGWAEIVYFELEPTK